MKNKRLDEIQNKGKKLKIAMIIILIPIILFALLFFLAVGYDNFLILLLLLIIIIGYLIFYGHKMEKNPDKYIKDYIQYNSNIEKIFDIFSQELINLPNIKNSDLEENGKIYYMNGENGTIFDWIMNEKTSDFMCFYKDGSCGAAKLRVNKDSRLNMYLYESGQKSPFLEKDIKEKFRKEDVYELAIILNLVMDENGIFDRAINDYNFNVVIDNKKRQEFDNLCNERIR